MQKKSKVITVSIPHCSALGIPLHFSRCFTGSILRQTAEDPNSI